MSIIINGLIFKDCNYDKITLLPNSFSVPTVDQTGLGNTVKHRSHTQNKIEPVLSLIR